MVVMMRYPLLIIGLICISYQVRAINLLLNDLDHNDHLSFNENATTTIRCNVVNNTESESLMWYRGTQQINVNAEHSVNTSTICLPSLAPEDDGVSFTCVLKSDTSKKLSVKLNVTYEPKLSGDTQIIAEEGKMVKITCGFKANPAAVMFWRQNGSVVTFPTRFEQVMIKDSMTLTITKAEKTDTANYTCVAQPPGDLESTLNFELIVGDRKPGLPIEAIAAAVVVGALIIAFSMFARRGQIFKSCMKSGSDTAM